MKLPDTVVSFTLLDGANTSKDELKLVLSLDNNLPLKQLSHHEKVFLRNLQYPVNPLENFM